MKPIATSYNSVRGGGDYWPLQRRAYCQLGLDGG